MTAPVVLRTPGEIWEAGLRDQAAAGWPPLTQEQADYAAALLAPYAHLLAVREPQAA